MKSWLRAKPRGLISFLLIAALVAGGLGWVTVAALRLEGEQHQARAEAEHAEKLRQHQRERDQTLTAFREQKQQQDAAAQAEFAAKLRLALWRLDSRIAPVLAREDTRNYNHYSAVFAPSVVLDSKGNRVAPAVVLEPSPLLNADLPDWMLLHFQVAPESGWGSPQVLSASSVEHLGRNGISAANVTSERRQLLTELKAAVGSTKLMKQLRQQELQLASAQGGQTVFEGSPLLSGDGNTLKNFFYQQQDPGQGQNPSQQLTQKQRDSGYGGRIASRAQTNNESKFGPYDDSAWSVMLNTSNLIGGIWNYTGKPRPGSRDQVIVSTGPMTPLWLTVGDNQERLVVARTVRINNRWPDYLALLGGPFGQAAPVAHALSAAVQSTRSKLPVPRALCQGIVLDWPRLQALLADEVSDLFPQARIVPMREEVPAHPERTMTALPVELDPGPAPAPPPPPTPPEQPAPARAVVPDLGWTPLRIGLALAWAAALVALGAVGLGGWSLIDLSERRIRFVSAVTHELRTPLTTLRLYLDMLTGGLVQREEQRAEYLQTLNVETDRLNRLVGNVLDFSRLENQHPRLEKAPVAVAELLEQVRATWQGRCHDVEKELVVEDGTEEHARVLTDAQLVQQILGNLIDNACKYSRGAEDPHIWLRAKAEGSRLLLEVEDRGPGVPARERRSIFRAFSRGRTADVTAGGVGLGLALAQRWAQLLGGKVTLCGERVAGACFRLELPLR